MPGVVLSRGSMHLIEADDLPEYPEELCDPSLTADFFTKFWHDRWLSSRLHLTGSLAVQGAALNLFFLSRKQVPVGSLPDDDHMLARLLRVSVPEFQALRDERVGPLHNWQRFRYRDETVLGHDVVIEVARDALHRREARRASNDDKAVRARIDRLCDLMRDLKIPEAICRDATLVGRIDAWLLEHHKGQRRRPQIDASVMRAMRFAESQGWIAEMGAR